MTTESLISSVYAIGPFVTTGNGNLWGLKVNYAKEERFKAGFDKMIYL